MSKYPLVKAVALALFAFASTYAYHARAGEVISVDSNEVFVSGTSLELVEVGTFNPRASDEGDKYGPYYWRADVTDAVWKVVSYASGAAYDYAAHGLTRNPYLVENESPNSRYLDVSLEDTLRRSIFERVKTDDDFSNVVVRTGTRESIYCDMLTRFTPCDEVASIVSGARVSVWVRIKESEVDGVVSSETNLMVSAGYLSEDFKSVTRRDYVLDISNVCADNVIDLSRWYRLTIRAHGDVSRTGVGIGGFSVYLDGQPIRGLADGYEICANASRIAVWLSPEARALRTDRRLFPSMAKIGSNAAVTVDGVTFTGDGLLDDITFSSTDPGYAKPEAVLTLAWDAGITTLKYSLDNGLTTNAAPLASARSVDLLFGVAPTNGTLLKIVEVAYDTANGYTPGVWSGSDGMVLTNGTEFVYVGAPASRNPSATVASSRESFDVGPGATYDIFADAIAAMAASTNKLKVLTLQTNIVVTMTNYVMRGKNKLRDQGCVYFDGDVDYVLDLNGHTLRGQTGKRGPTVVAKCKSLRICDSSLEKTGCIQPVGAYTDEDESQNTAVRIYPDVDKSIFPVVTLQHGIYDGWVRNEASHGSGVNAEDVSGTLYVEGGSYISTNAATFYLESCVTNLHAQFVYRGESDIGYWSCLATNAVIWTGLGDGRSWTDPNNWRIKAVPNDDEIALFPSREAGADPWTVDVGNGQMTTSKLWLENDIRLSGTNDFTDVTLEEGGKGRVCGDAMLIYKGTQPGRLTETTLRDDWAGTVVLREIGLTLPKILKNIETWGTADSTVFFNGVRGYVMDVSTLNLPYDFVMEDYTYTTTKGVVQTVPAWRNDSGYSGSSLAFWGKLTGSGTFQSGANTRAVLQIFKFVDVKEFTGKFIVNGKRVLLGAGLDIPSVAGLIMFGDQVFVRSGLGWTCKRAAFADTLHIIGQTNDVLVTATGKEPDVTVCTNVTLNGESGVAWLATTNNPKWAVYVTGTRPSWLPTPDPLLSKAALMQSFYLSASSPTDVSDYNAAALGTSATALRSTTLALAATAVEEADVSILVEDDYVGLVVSNATRGYWYAVRYRPSLDADWEMPSAKDWVQATGPSVTLECTRQGDAGFYGVVLSIDNPCSGGGGSE